MYLLNTNVVSELSKVRAGKADARVALWADSVDAVDLFLSAITLQELEIGVLLAERRDPKQGRCSGPGSSAAYSLLLRAAYCPWIWRSLEAARGCMSQIPVRCGIRSLRPRRWCMG